MGIAERKSREREERHKLILEKAKELILEKGVDALNMQEIAEACELSKATLYLYFENKESLLAEILDEAADSFCSFVESRIEPGASGIEALRTAWASHLAMFGESQDIIVLTGIMRAVDPAAFLAFGDGIPAVRGAATRLRSLISGILVRGMEDGTLLPGLDPERLTRTVILIATSVIDAVARLPREARDVRVVMEELRGIFEILLRGVAAPGTDHALLELAPGGNRAGPERRRP